MSLLDRLRPKWQSADADVRADAVRELSRDEVELLTAVAQQDADPKVRRIAIKKLDSPRLLLEIAEKDEDSRVRDFARKRACQILVQIACDDRDLEESRRALELLDQPGDRIAVHERARFPELRSEALASFTGESEIFELVRRAKDPEVRARALARIESPLLLKKVVFDEAAGDLALSAVSRIEDLPALESIYEQPSLGNAVRRHALSKLEKLVPHDHPIKVAARQERFLDVCVRAESFADARSIEEAARLRTDWTALESEGAPDPQLLERFRSALERIDAVAAAAARRAAEPAAPPPDPAAAPVEDPRLIAIVEALTALDREGIASGVDEAGARWTEAVNAGARPGLELELRFRSAFEKARAAADERAAEALHAEGARVVDRAELAIEEADVTAAAARFREAAREWKRLQRTPRPPSADLADLVERFRRAEEKLEEREGALRREREDALQATLSELEQRVKRMDGLSALSEVPIKDAEREMREAQEFLKSMGPLPAGVNRRKARTRLTEARRKLFQRTQETRTLDEWKRWANVDVQKHLIERIESLRASNDVPRIAKEIRAIHEEWKKAGAATPDQADELWTQYKSVRDELKGRCNDFFKKQAAERKENLKKKEELSEQVEALKDSQDWNATADAIKALQQQWKKLGPVPRSSSDAIWSRFRAACDHFFDRRKQVFDRARSERDENLANKIALCERAESLRESTSWQETVEELKKLQAQWREIGAVPRKSSDEVWNRFRAACDRFFERYKRRDEVDLQERMMRREELVAEAESLAAAPAASSEAVSRVNEIWEEWKKLGPPGREDRDWSERLERAVASVVFLDPESFSGGDLDPRASRKKRQKLCQRLESVVEELDSGRGSSAPLEDLAQRLKDALASNTMTGGKRPPARIDWRGASDEVARIRNTWLRTAPVPGDEGLALAERFHKALRTFDELSRPEEAASRTGS